MCLLSISLILLYLTPEEDPRRYPRYFKRNWLKLNESIQFRSMSILQKSKVGLTSAPSPPIPCAPFTLPCNFSFSIVLHVLKRS